MSLPSGAASNTLSQSSGSSILSALNSSNPNNSPSFPFTQNQSASSSGPSTPSLPTTHPLTAPPAIKRQRTDDTLPSISTQPNTSSVSTPVAPTTYKPSFFPQSVLPPSLQPAPANLSAALPQHADTVLPSSLPTLISDLTDYESTIPIEVIQFLLERSGCSITDPSITKLVSLATQRFVLSLCHDSQQYSRMRVAANANNAESSENPESSDELTVADVCGALRNQGIIISKPQYFADKI